MEQNEQVKESKKVTGSRYRSRDTLGYAFKHSIKAQTGSCSVCVCVYICVSMFLCVCLGMSMDLCICTSELIKKVKLKLRAI